MQTKMAVCKRIPVYQSILDNLKQQILSAPPKIHFLSESKIINDFNVSATTARKVLDELEHLGLVKREQGRGSIVISPNEKQVKDFAAIFFKMYDPKAIFISDIILGIHEKMQNKTGIFHLLCTGNQPIGKNNTSTINYLVTHHKIQGLFILSPIHEQDIRFFIQERMPFVILSNKYTGIEVPCVIPDYRKVIFNICDWLTQSGCLKIGFITSLRCPKKIQKSGDFIYSAHREFLEQKGLPFREDFFKEKGTEEKEGYRAMSEFFAMPSGNRPQAIVVTQADIARGAMHFMEEKQWHPVLIPFAEQPINYPHYVLGNFRQMGIAAFNLMERQIQEQRFLNETVMVPFNFVVQEKQKGGMTK